MIDHETTAEGYEGSTIERKIVSCFCGGCSWAHVELENDAAYREEKGR